ncbi:hypothetical protein NDI47_05870 [Microcoleus vaginatus GB1-A2]|uniref:hypothetical protein n=1 Tax=Microcoleus vaginatus TaxID=119532 RepID=UPI001688F2A8|nr:hypothetical protein [Microcoleus sp. FACHB-61]
MTDYPLSANINTDHSNMDISSIEVSHQLSFSHIKAAAHFAKLSYEKEDKYDDSQPSSELRDEHRSYVIGSIITAVCYLEATINELFTNVEYIFRSNEWSPDLAEKMNEEWANERRLQLIEKYEKALYIVKSESFDRGAEPYQSAASLISLRNALIHYKPEWIGTGESYNQTLNEKLRQKLENKIKKLNPMTREGSLFFPHRCLGYGCAKWAVESSLNFSNEFFSKIGLPSNLDQDYQLSLNLPEI